MQNQLYYGDNLYILRDHIADESVDLIYLDPPFNSSRNYNVLFKDQSGSDSEAQITAFEDTWDWGPTARDMFHELTTSPRVPHKVGKAIDALHMLLGENPMMAYLVMMAIRLVELHRVLKPTGSIYLHCDPTASHYLKIILDALFGVENFRNEITWKRTSSHNDTKRKYGDVADIIFFYSKSRDYVFNVQYADYNADYIEKFYRFVDENGRRYRKSDLRSPNPRPNLMYDYKGYKPHQNGWAVSYEKMVELDKQGRLAYPNKPDGRIQLRRYLDEMQGVPVSSVWDDIQPVQAQAAERLGYPTQKPVSLLERIVAASSNEGDIVLDCFAGCGTTIAAAQKLKRHWIGIDITHLGINLLKNRLRDEYELKPHEDYKVIGEPIDVAGARDLADQDTHEFQLWALSLVQARPFGGEKGKKGADRGIDGVITFKDASHPDKKDQQHTAEVIVQVKSGKNISSKDIRDLVGTMERQKAALGVFITLEPATSAMTKEALSAGLYNSPLYEMNYPRLQILTIDELLRGKDATMPPRRPAHQEAKLVSENVRRGVKQKRLDF
jgi:site-specific DNA-methyltransferase (adenine-specific)